MWYVIPVNPEPWAIGTPGIGKRGGKLTPYISPNPQLAAYKQAVQEALADAEPLPQGDYQLTFYFWRRLDSYETQSGRRHRKHAVDATNMQKATEDALQGVLFDNDRNVQDVRSIIVHQGSEVDGLVILEAKPWTLPDVSAIPNEIAHSVSTVTRNREFDNSWPPKEWQ